MHHAAHAPADTHQRDDRAHLWPRAWRGPCIAPSCIHASAFGAGTLTPAADATCSEKRTTHASPPSRTHCARTTRGPGGAGHPLDSACRRAGYQAAYRQGTPPLPSLLGRTHVFPPPSKLPVLPRCTHPLPHSPGANAAPAPLHASFTRRLVRTSPHAACALTSGSLPHAAPRTRFTHPAKQRRPGPPRALSSVV